jgi:hypothetical protein
MILEQAYQELEKEVPTWLCKGLRRLRAPGAKWIRLPIGLAFIAGSFLWFLPVVGIEMLPVGLLLIAQDVPFLRKPVGHAILWLVKRWRRLREWWNGQ